MSEETKAEVEKYQDLLKAVADETIIPLSYMINCTLGVIAAIMHLADEIERITMERNR